MGASLWKSLGLLLLALTLATIIGALGFFILRLFIPDIPLYVALFIGSVGLVFILRYISQRYEWIMPWYYLLPAIIFLLTFTLFPVILTIILAFSNYAGIRNGELNVSSETALTATQGNVLTLSDAQTLSCSALLSLSEVDSNRREDTNLTGCEQVKARIYSSGRLVMAAIAIEDKTLTLAEAVPAGRQLESVELFIPDFGFAQQVKVVSVVGNVVGLERTPAGKPNLDQVTLSLNRDSLERTIVSLEGNTLTLDKPLPEGGEYTAIARYNKFKNIGFDNFKLILRQATQALMPVFAWNFSFAVLTIIINTIIGTFIALLLNNPELRFRNLYRTLLIVPWALPGIITIQVWRGFLNTNFGAINRFLAVLDLPTFDWLGDCNLARAAVLLVNLWLGLPFMMTAVLGALSAIPRDIYEAARIDGANAWQSFWQVTAPLLRTAMIPITLSGFAYNFNNFNIIYLLTDGGPPSSWGTSTARCTDILISWAYNEAFRSQGGYAYGLGSAISLLIFFITLAVSLMNFKVTGALKETSNV